MTVVSVNADRHCGNAALVAFADAVPERRVA
jgi:hypothetical protein